MKRQRLRQAFLLISLLLFPVTLYYLSPVLALSGAFEGIVTGSLIVFGMQFLSSLVLGRAFCGWLCPAGGLQEASARVNHKRVKRGRWLKYLIWLPWLAAIAWGFRSAGGLRAIQPFYLTTRGISVADPYAYIIYYSVVGLILVLSFTVGRRSFCHHVCWMAPFMVIGSAIRTAARWPAWRIRIDPQKCTGCGRCSQNCPMSLEVCQSLTQPPGQSVDCILCGECVDHCPRGALRFHFGLGQRCPGRPGVNDASDSPAAPSIR